MCVRWGDTGVSHSVDESDCSSIRGVTNSRSARAMLSIKAAPKIVCTTFQMTLARPQARFLPRSSTVLRHTRLPVEVLLRIVTWNSDFKTAIVLHRVFGFPLEACMARVSWPQNRMDMPAALFLPDPEQDIGCSICGTSIETHACFVTLPDCFGEEDDMPMFKGYADSVGRVWDSFTQSMEDGYNDEVYMIRSWADELQEYSEARALNGELVARQAKRHRDGEPTFWRSADVFCTCGGQWHDAWEECPEVMELIGH